jgi:hypothetical protein
MNEMNRLIADALAYSWVIHMENFETMHNFEYVRMEGNGVPESQEIRCE